MAAKDKTSEQGEQKTSARNPQLDAVLAQIRKEFGDTSIMRLGDAAAAQDIDVIEVYGQESSGKTTLALHVVANAQKRGGTAAFVDAEHALDPGYARKIGVNLDDLLVAQPNSGEEALTITEQLVKSGALDVIVVDSVAALTPQAEIDGNMGDSHVGLQARLMSQAMRKLTSTLAQTKTLCIFTNQIREKIGIMFGNPETTPGGKALKFYASCRLQVQRIGAIKDTAGAVVGNRTRVKVVKNKVAPPFTEAEFDILYTCGISWEGSVLDAALARGIVEKRGSWLSYGSEQLAQGQLATIEFLKTHPETVAEIVEKVKSTPILPGGLVKKR